MPKDVFDEDVCSLLALALFISLGTVTTMTYAGYPAPALTEEKGKEKKSTGPKAGEEEKKDKKKQGGH